MHFKVSSRIQLISAPFALAIVAGFAGLALAREPARASADDGHRNADVTFTKWVTNTTAFPWDMKGIVGGDVGGGTFTGEVLSRVDDGTTTTIHALYHVKGKHHSFTADLHVTQSDATGAAILTGVVVDGWLKGLQVTGAYATLSVCDISTPGNVFGTVCFLGTLHIKRGSKH